MRITATVEDSVGESIEALAAAEKRSVSSYVARLIEADVEKKKTSKKKEVAVEG